jgi:hypothetical protein
MFAMLQVDFSLRPHLAYRNTFVELHGRSQELTATLEDGAHTFESDSFDIGVLHSFQGRKLLGQITFRYHYDESLSVITVCDTDFSSADAMCLITVPEGTSERCYQRAAPGGFVMDDLMANPHWIYRTPLTPGLEDVLRGMARSASESLIAALKEMPGLIVQVRQHPPEVSVDDYRQLLTVYRNGAFLGFYEPGREYGPDDTVRTIESVYGGLATFPQNAPFANVIGSTNDPKVDGQTWKNLWYNKVGVYPQICTSFQFEGFPCTDRILGGHVVKGKVAQVVQTGSDSVYIFPICQRHNDTDSVYMEVLKYETAVWLKNYMGQ